MTDNWDSLEEKLLAQREPSEDDVDYLVGHGVTHQNPKALSALYRLLRSKNTELCYELCHALLDFEIPITEEIAEAVKPLLDNPSRRIFMAALHVTLMQKNDVGLRQWESLRKDAREDWRGIGDSLVKHITR